MLEEELGYDGFGFFVEDGEVEVAVAAGDVAVEGEQEFARRGGFYVVTGGCP